MLPGSIRDISDDTFLSCDGLTIYAPGGSYAENYAKNKNIPFVSTDKVEKTDARVMVFDSMIVHAETDSDKYVDSSVTPDIILNFWNYVISTCETDDINDMVKEFGFDIERLTERNLSGLTANELATLFADVVYMVLNGVGNGDFQTMYSILSETLGIDSDVIDSVLNY